MGAKSVDKRFALIADNGEFRYPFQKSQKKTDRYGFALTAPGDEDKDGGGTYTTEIEEVVKRVVLDGWSVRAMATEPRPKPGNTTGLGKRGFHKFWLSPELRYLVSHSSREMLADSDVTIESDNVSVGIPVTDRHDDLLLRDLDHINQENTEADELTERMDSRLSRIGQGEFRKNTITTWGGEEKCALSGIAIREILIASHIIPWSEDKVQRKKGCNGILLAAHLDRLFDRHLIGFQATSNSNVYSMKVAPRLSAKHKELVSLGLANDTTLDLSNVNRSDRAGLEVNLRRHLERVFINT